MKLSKIVQAALASQPTEAEALKELLQDAIEELEHKAWFLTTMEEKAFEEYDKAMERVEYYRIQLGMVRDDFEDLQDINEKLLTGVIEDENY